MFEVNFTNRQWSRQLPAGKIFFAVCACAVLAGCASAAQPAKGTGGDPLAKGRAAAQSAIDDMEAGGRFPDASTGQRRQEAAAPATAEPPAWVSSPYSVYDDDAYVAAVGYGSTRNAAERGALASLTAIFGQSVQSEISSVSNYSEAVNNGSLAVSGNNAMREAIKTSSEMDSLIGAEIADVWQNSADRFWSAVAVLDKKKAAALYADLLRGNQRLITEVTAIPEGEKDSLEAFSRYQLAATVADTNKLYANLLHVLGGSPVGLNPAEVKGGGDYRLAAAKIARNIPVAVKVEGDVQNRIANAFAVTLGKIGFKSGGNDNRYVLNASVNITDANLPGNQFQFCRYNIDAYLTDLTNGSRLAPYNINGREGHTAMSEAKIRAIDNAAKKIEADYEKVFDSFFSTNLLK
jgi:hypothetical protein